MLNLFIFSTISITAQKLARPVISPSPGHVLADENGDVWYYIQFKNQNAVIEDMGNNANLKTATKTDNSDAQLWKLTGTEDNYILENKLGRKMNYASSRYTASSTSSVAIKLFETTNDTYAPAWEIQRVGSGSSVNMHQGAGTGRELAEYNAGDNNNPLAFVSPNEYMLMFPEISTEDDTKEIWYYIQFKREGAVLQDMGNAINIKTKNPRKNDAQLWKITGTADNYTIVGKSGRRISWSGSYFQTSTTNSVTFKILTTGNTTFEPALELQRIGSTQYMNQHGGAGADKYLAEWSYGDPNNPLIFIKAEDMEMEAEITGSASAPEAKYSLWYREPATKWMTHALPVGNGQFGAMVFGGIRRDEVQFNDKTLWTGHTTSYGAYQNFGNLYIENKEISEVADYRRELDIENAIARVTYKIGDVVYTREYFASNPDSAVVIYLTASQPGKIDAGLTFVGAHKETTTYTNTGAVFNGKLDLVSYYARMSIENAGGTASADENGIKVEGANSLKIVFRGKTNYSDTADNYLFSESLVKPQVDDIVSKAMAKSYDALKQTHIADYKQLFARVAFSIDGTQNTIPTDELINVYNSAGYKNLFIEELYYHYGRYLMISSARGMNLPSNLQGIWNHVNNPPWNSDIHSNINVQMNYWLAENTNLSELHHTFLNYIHKEATKTNGQWYKNATNSTYSKQTKGWTLFTENNIFGYHGTFMHNYVIANAWYCMHLWQHYRYTLDEDYLRNVAFEPMKTCADYWLERLKLATDGTYVCPNEYSPEHGPDSEDGTAHSQQLVWDLFNNTLQAIEILGESSVDAAFLADLRNKFEKLDKGLAIEDVAGNAGQLREWKYSHNNHPKAEATHRHMSHLMGLYPGNQIAPSINQDYFNAAVKSLRDRGDQSTGWAMGWKINLWARALDGEHARLILNKALRLSTTTGNGAGDGGVYQNLFDSHAPFQIDGNFGATAGITEMLMQSHLGTIQILPALPTAWSKGNISGLRAINNFEVGIDWENNRATEVRIKSYSGKNCVIECSGAAGASITDENGQAVQFDVVGNNKVSFPTQSGMSYTIVPAPTSIPTYSKIKGSAILEITDKILTVRENEQHISLVNVYSYSGQLIGSRASSFVFQLPAKGSYLVNIWYDNDRETRKIIVS